MFKLRNDEPDYAFIPNTPAPPLNQYGNPITLASENDELYGKSLNINGDASIGNNPNRYKQHGFYFNADNCIACHACESACSEKNDLPAYLAYRSVGYLEGGAYPNYTRINISMACNHCDDPVCLKGCPTRAYTKFAEYGAVLQDPDICFGCGYCTWVCPYNAPQLDTQRGHVHKCNMCVDRLEVGLKPACAAACLAGALDFGVVETKPEHRDQLKTQIPGFPDPSISRPNIRFQQTKTLPQELTRPDAIPLRYERDGDRYTAKVKESAQAKQWNLKKLSSRENPLVLFTLISQMVIGTFALMAVGNAMAWPILTQISPGVQLTVLISLLGLQSLALLLSTVHLGRPHRFYRGFNNLRYSPVSREAASLMVFFAMLGVYTGVYAFSQVWPIEIFTGFAAALPYLAGAGTAFGVLTLYFMQRIYRIPARPFWNHWQVMSSFYGTMLTLGGALLGTVYAIGLLIQLQPLAPLLVPISLIMIAGIALEGIGLFAHARAMRKQQGEGMASHYQQTTQFGLSYRLRNGLMIAAIVALLAITVFKLDGISAIVLWSMLILMISLYALIGRALFYVLVIPTTMPGAFFWRNRGFVEHARATGLANMPQVGVLADEH